MTLTLLSLIEIKLKSYTLRLKCCVDSWASNPRHPTLLKVKNVTTPTEIFTSVASVSLFKIRVGQRNYI